jgi:Zn-dependent protease with chaperone function
MTWDLETRGGNMLRIVSVSIVSFLLASVALAQRSGPDTEELHARASEELRALDPAAADAFERGWDAGERYDNAAQLRAYEEVVRRAPSSSHGHRMLARSSMVGHGDEARALRSMRRAVELDRSAINLADLSLMLLDLREPTLAQRTEAAQLAEEAVRVAPEEPWGYVARLAAATATSDDATARLVMADLERIADPITAAHGLANAALIAIYRDPLASAAPRLAHELLGRANALAPDDLEVLCVKVYLAVFENQPEDAVRAARSAVAVAPRAPGAHYALAIAHASNADWDASERALEASRERGLSDEQYEMVSSRLWWSRNLIWIALAVIVGTPLAAYFGTILFLFLAGWLLSALTLRAASKLPTESSGRAVGMAGWLRWTYRVVLWLCCAFYYVSLPLIVIGMILFAGGLVLGALAIGVIPIKLLLILGIFVVVTIFAIGKSLLTRVRDEDPGPRLDVASHPRFAAALREVAARIGTREVDAVYLTPGTDIAVAERGGMWKQLRRKTERCLILGIGVLEGMSVQELKAILAHEHGHFKNEDTAGGSFALAVRRSLMLMAVGLVRGGAASMLNPAWWFTVLFSKLFSRISQGASRLQEVLADRWAIYAYGSEPFVRGLRHVISESVRFDARAAVTIEEVVKARAPLANFYRYEAEKPIEQAEIDRAIETVLSREPSAYDSHPAPRDRIAWATALGASGEGTTDDSDAWSLFADRDALERTMTDEIRENVSAAYGVEIPR